MIKARLLLIALLAAAAGGAFPFSEPVHLVRIGKGDARLWNVLTKERIEVVQELQTCYLAMTDRYDIAVLRRAGVSVEVIERNARGRSFVVLPAVSAEDRAALARAGRLTAVEPAVLLFRTDAGDPARYLPQGLARKPLPSATVLPYLRPPALPAAISPGGTERNDIIDRLVADVSDVSLRSLVEALQDLGTRYTATPGCDAAAQYIFAYFIGLGLNVRFQDVPSSAGVSRNIIAELPGKVYPDDVLVICGHYDSYSNQRLTLAPGADDNASGTAATMEAARILSRQPLDFTVRFIAFTAEELGLLGSAVYARDVRSRGERIVGVLDLDMIAYADRLPEDLEVIANNASDWLAAKFAAVSGAYGLITANRRIDASALFSDHAPFWDRGYAAVCAIEDDPIVNPFYHRTTDTIDTLSFDFYAQATRAALATLAELAQPVRPGCPATPAGLTATSYLYVSLFGIVRNTELNWPAGAGASSYNIYRSGVSHQDYQKLNTEPLTRPTYTDRELTSDRGYFYVVTAVGPTGLESNNSTEVEVAPSMAVEAAGAAGRLAFEAGGAR